MKKLIVLIATIVFALTLISCATTGTPVIGTSTSGKEVPIEDASIKLVSDVKDGGYQLVNAVTLNKWMAEKKDILIIDAMPSENFIKTHIKGAVNSAFPKTDKEVTPAEKADVVKIAGSDKNKTIVTYCGFTSCRRSHFAAKTLVEKGYKNVYRFPGGITAWKENQFPVE